MKARNKLIAGAGAVLVIVAIFYTAVQVTQPIRIGVILSSETVTGNEAFLFIRYYQGTHPKIGLRPVEFLLENVALEEDQIRNAYRKLEAQGVSAIIGGDLSKDATWIAEESSKTGIPTFGILASSTSLSNKTDGFFRLNPTSTSQASAAAFYYTQEGVERLVLLTSPDNSVYVEPFVDSIAANFDGEILRIPFDPNADIEQQISDADPDGIFMILPPEEFLEVIETVKMFQPQAVVGSSSWGSDALLSTYTGPVLEGVLFFSLDKTIYGENYKAELAAFKKLYHLEASKASEYTVSVLNILYQAIREVGSSREALREYFETPRLYDTSYGEVMMDEYGDVSTDRIIVLETIEGSIRNKEIFPKP
jgi:ABC-type branched-subunit amino acid transport system substrate-binding protein